MTQKEKLTKLLDEAEDQAKGLEYIFGNQVIADYLLANNVVVLPCRCKECEHHHWEQEPCHGKTVHYCDLPHMRSVEIYKDFFCGFAKRKGRDE